MVLGSQIDENNFSPDKDRLVLKYYGKSVLQPDFKPPALHAPDATGQVDAKGISLNFKIGSFKPYENFVVPEKTGIICDEEWENLLDNRHHIPGVKIAQSNPIDLCQWKELCTEEKDKVKSENRKSTVVAVKGNEKVISKDEGQKSIVKKTVTKKNSGERFPQEKLALVTDKDGEQKKACRSRKRKSREYFSQQFALTQDEVMEKVTSKDEGQKTIVKKTATKKNSGEKFPQEKLALVTDKDGEQKKAYRSRKRKSREYFSQQLALTQDEGKFMVFSVILAVYWFANDIKLKLEGFTWMFLKEVLNYASSILSFTKKSRNKGCWMVCLILLLCISFGNIRAMALKGKVNVSLEDSNSIRIYVKPDKNAMGTSKWLTKKTDGKIKIVAFNGRVKPQFQRKVHLENETSIRISNLSFEDWKSIWTYQKGTDFPIGTKQLSEYVDPVCSDNLAVVGSSNTSTTVMWDSGLDRGHYLVTILQYRVDGSTGWMSAYNTTVQTNQEVNFSISDLKQGTSYDIRLLTLDENGSSSICKTHLITVKTKLAKPATKKTYYIMIIEVFVVGFLILLVGKLIYSGYKRLQKKKDEKKTESQLRNTKFIGTFYMPKPKETTTVTAV